MIYLYYLYQDDKIKYVGLTKNIKNRQRAHQKIKPPHTFVLVESFSDVSTASDAEIYHIQKNNTYQDGWNQSPGGEYKNSSGYNRKKIGGVKKGTTPWNKGKKGSQVSWCKGKRTSSRTMKWKITRDSGEIIIDNLVYWCEQNGYITSTVKNHYYQNRCPYKDILIIEKVK